MLSLIFLDIGFSKASVLFNTLAIDVHLKFIDKNLYVKVADLFSA